MIDDDPSSTSTPAFWAPVAPSMTRPVSVMSCAPAITTVLPPEAGTTCTAPALSAWIAIGAPALPEREVVNPA